MDTTVAQTSVRGVLGTRLLRRIRSTRTSKALVGQPRTTARRAENPPRRPKIDHWSKIDGRSGPTGPFNERGTRLFQRAAGRGPFAVPPPRPPGDPRR